jgi:Tfp pilus assembly protein PilF
MTRFLAGGLVFLLLSGCAMFRSSSFHDALTPAEHVTLARAYTASGETDAAQREYEAALATDRDYLPAILGLGNLAFEQGHLDAAERQFTRALSIDPLNAAASNNLAMVYVMRRDRLDDAERLARAALERGGPLRPYILDTLASVYVQQRRYAEAERTLTQADAEVPAENTELRDRLAKLRQELAADQAAPAIGELPR